MRLPYISKIVLSVVTAVCSVCIADAQTNGPLTVAAGAGKPAIFLTPENNSGLNNLIVLENAPGIKISYTASTGGAVKWYRYSSLGGGFAEEIPFSVESSSTTYITAGQDDMGYIVETGATGRYYFWVVNYANHRCRLSALDISPEQDCFTTNLVLGGSADKITYYSINGVGKTLSRDLKLAYTTLVYNQDSGDYDVAHLEQLLQNASGEIHVTAPLCDTEFRLSGDRFLEQWGEMQSVVSPTFPARSVEANTSATQTDRDNLNEQKVETPLGGSAPVEVEFRAVTTDAVIYREWQFSMDPSFDVIDMRVNENEVTQTFNDYGTVYVRFVAGNDSNSCDYTSEVYSVYVGESQLDCPNAFSPGASEGTNDEWKVSYKSIIEFDCHIFNRWGLEMAHLTDPAQGWDGRYSGKLVPSGVYYYVIRAKGADGKDYKLSGDINIIHYKSSGGLSGTAQ